MFYAFADDGCDIPDYDGMASSMEAGDYSIDVQAAAAVVVVRKADHPVFLDDAEAMMITASNAENATALHHSMTKTMMMVVVDVADADVDKTNSK